MQTPAERPPAPPQNPAGRYGTVEWADYFWNPDFYGFPGRPFRFSFFVARLRWIRVFGAAALGVGRYREPSAECSQEPTESHGESRIGKMGELRLESGFLGIPSAAFCFLVASPRLRWSRVFIVYTLGVGR